MSKSLLDLSSQAQKGNFRAMLCFLSELNFDEFPLERRRLEIQALQLTLPVNKRQEEAELGVSFRKYCEGGYFIEVNTTFDKEKESFNKTGRVSVLIKYPILSQGLPKVFQCYFNRIEGLCERVHALVFLLDVAMRNHPYSKHNGTLMSLTRGDELESYFVGEDSDTEKISLFDERFVSQMPLMLQDTLNEVLDIREQYATHIDPNTTPIEKIKRVRTPQTPDKVVPSHNP